MNFKEYDYIIPIGSNCRIGEALNELGYRKNSFPIDWTLNSTRSVFEVFKNEFKDYFNKNSCEVQYHQMPNGKKFQYILNTKYHLNITHEKQITQEAIEKYDRRIKRILNILNSNSKVLFIRNLLDGDVKDTLHQHYILCEEKMGYSHTDLEWIYKLKDLFDQKYTKMKSDILVIHYGEISNKRPDIYFEKSNAVQNNFTWDRTACINLIKEINA